MRCPSCNQRPLRFTRWLRTLNPYRLTCGHCGKRLKAGSLPYVWTGFHVFIVLGLIQIERWTDARGLVSGPWFLLPAAAVVFVTAFVIPWLFFNHAYHLAD